MTDIELILDRNAESLGTKMDKIVALGYTKEYAWNIIKEHIKNSIPPIPDFIPEDEGALIDIPPKEHS